MRFSITKLLADKAGNTIAIFVAALIPLTAMMGSAIDISMTYTAKTKMQNACDAAVLAGRLAMVGPDWTELAEAEAHKFFDFNFPSGTNGVTNAKFEISQDEDDPAVVIASATGDVPFSFMKIFGFDSTDISASCTAKKEMGHNDIMLVLDVTGSMKSAPSAGGGTKISRLRKGTNGLYRALQDDTGASRTRFGVVSYSHTVNVGRSLADKDILDSQVYSSSRLRCNRSGCKILFEEPSTITAEQSQWGSKDGFRNSGDACIEERPSEGRTNDPFKIRNTVTSNDINLRSTGDNDTLRQFGRYSPQKHKGRMQYGCPSESFRLRAFNNEDQFDTAIASATSRVTGGTYHDVGILWGARFLSSNGFFASDNPSSVDGVPVNKHIVFMTDGKLATGYFLYSSHGIEVFQKRTEGGGNYNNNHRNRFKSACNAAKSMGMTIWVIAFDVTDVGDIKPCATSEGHFYTSDGDDLEEVFEQIGQGIGNLRLTQ